MLKKRAYRKILVTTLTVFLILCIYLIPNSINKEEILKTNVEIKELGKINKCNIYLMNENKMLVRTTAITYNDKLEQKIRDIIYNLTSKGDNYTPNGLSTIIPKNTKVLGLKIDEGIVQINFSKEILDIEEEIEEIMIEAISYSILELKEITGVSIYVEGENITNLINTKIPSIITKDFGINKSYNLNSNKDIIKYVIYYIENIDNKEYYVPVTRYSNDSREKIKVIIENLSSSYIYEPNLISFLDHNTKLINYEIENDTMVLNFNNSIFISDGNILEEVVYSIAYSVFDNYNVNSLVIKANNKEILKKTMKELE